MTRRLTPLFLTAIAVIASACVHELPPDTNPGLENTLEVCIAHPADWTTRTHEVETATRASATMMRYVVRTYPPGMAQHFNAAPLTEQVITRPATLDDFTITLDRPSGEVELWVWADGIGSDGRPLHYDASRLNEVKLTTSPYPACDDSRDAMCGGIAMHPDDRSLTLQLGRPVARYEFVATDLAEFLREESADAGLEGYRVEFVYTGYLTTAYNAFLGLNYNSVTSITYAGSLRRISETEASLGFDHVFTSGGESAVSVQAYLITPSGVRRAISPVVNVPIAPGVNTLVRGAFLTVRDQGGIDIDVDFSGDINIII